MQEGKQHVMLIAFYIDEKDKPVPVKKERKFYNSEVDENPCLMNDSAFAKKFVVSLIFNYI